VTYETAYPYAIRILIVLITALDLWACATIIIVLRVLRDRSTIPFIILHPAKRTGPYKTGHILERTRRIVPSI